MAKQSFGMVGLGVMGENLALNIESHGFSVVGFDLDGKKVDNFAARTKGKQVVAARTVAEFVANLDTPRRVLMMVPAGKAVDAVIADLRPYLKSGDLLIDAGKMEWLLRALAATDCPMSCPHGRPIALHYSTREVLKAFHRI